VRNRRGPKVAVLLVATALFAGGAGAIALWAPPGDSLKAIVDSKSPDGSADTFPLERIRRMQFRAGVYGACLLAAGALVLALRRPLTELVRRAAEDGAQLAAEWRAGLRAWVKHEPGHVLGLLCVVLVAAALRLAFVNQDMRYDEADSYLMFARRSLLYGVSDYPEPNNHLLNTVLMHVSTRLLGDAPWALRLPTLITGILIVPAAYWALRGWLGRWPALVAAGLTAGSSFLVHYSVNARGYSFVVLAFCVGLGLCNRMAARPNRGAALWLGLISALGFFAVPTMLFPFGACMLWLAWSALRERGDGRFLDRLGDILVAGTLTVALTLLLYGPVILFSGPGALTGNKYVSAPTWERLLEALDDRLSIFGTELARPPALALLLGLGLAVWVAVDIKRGAKSVTLLAAVVCWCAAIVLIQRAPPFGRVWTFVMPLAYGLGAAGLVWIVERTLRNRSGALAILVLVMTGWMSWDTYRSRSPAHSPEGERFESGQAVAAWFKEVLEPQDRVVSLSPVRTPLWYYMQRADLPHVIMAHEDGGPPFTYAVVNVPLEQFNEGLRYWKLPTLEADRLHPVREFPGATIYRIDPPLPH
jgi:hypothetical protein